MVARGAARPACRFQAHFDAALGVWDSLDGQASGSTAGSVTATVASICRSSN